MILVRMTTNNMKNVKIVNNEFESIENLHITIE